MVKFQPGDIVARSHLTAWWRATCISEHINQNDVFVVRACSKDVLTCKGWKFLADPAYFTLVSRSTKEEIIAARIKKLYSKCKTTAHWG